MNVRNNLKPKKRKLNPLIMLNMINELNRLKQERTIYCAPPYLIRKEEGEFNKLVKNILIEKNDFKFH
uniref:Uncharacterized protein n=1 Tax=Romanomermis culicivorax TaxID=13658 RepID=A0A915KQE6_ROMCU